MKANIVYEGSIVDAVPDFRLNDFGETLTFHLLKENGEAVDLTGKTVTLKAKELSEPKKHLFEEECNITDESAGYCELEIPESTLTALGSFSLVLEVAEASVIQASIDLGYLNIREAS